MRYRLLFTITFILMFLTGCTFHCRDKILQLQDLDLYLLIGQSNMAGRAPICREEQDTLDGVYLFTGRGDCPWVKAANPLNQFSTVHRGKRFQALGPGYSFAKAIHETSNGKAIGLIVNAREGTDIGEWVPGTTCYNEAVARTKKALKFGKLKGILWHQGENDVSDVQEYPGRLSRLITSLREDLDAPDVPFLAGELASSIPFSREFNIQLRETSKRIPKTAVISAEGLSTFDSVHFDASSARLLGLRYAEQLYSLVQ